MKNSLDYNHKEKINFKKYKVATTVLIGCYLTICIICSFFLATLTEKGRCMVLHHEASCVSANNAADIECAGGPGSPYLRCTGIGRLVKKYSISEMAIFFFVSPLIFIIQDYKLVQQLS